MAEGQVEIGDEFECGKHKITIIDISKSHNNATPKNDVIKYSIQSPGRPDREDSRYRDRFIEALGEYGITP